MHEAEKVLDMVIKARCHAAKVLQPRPQPLDLPAAMVATQCSPVLRRRFLPVRAVRRDQLNTAHGEFQVERVGVISLVADQACGLSGDKTLKESFSDKGAFMRRSRRRVDGEWKTSIVCHHHEFRAFTPLSLPTASPL